MSRTSIAKADRRRLALAATVLTAIVRTGETAVDAAAVPAAVAVIADAAVVAEGLAAAVAGIVADAAVRAGEDTKFFATDLADFQ
jgi:hypothetical protein